MNLAVPWIGVGVTYLLYQSFPPSFNVLFLINIWVFSLPHTFSTFTRSDRRSGRSIGLTILLLSVFLVGIITALNISGMVALYSFYFYWQQFHYGKQNLGVAMKETGSRSVFIDKIFYLGVVFLSLMGLFTGGAQSFFGYVLYSPIDHGLSKVSLFLVIMLLTILYVFIRPKQRLHAVSHSFIFSFSYLYCEHFAVGWLIMNVFHNLQYLKFMNSFEKNKSFILWPIGLTVILYLLQTHVVKGMILLSLPVGVGIMLAMNFTHYTLDAYIWKQKT